MNRFPIRPQAEDDQGRSVVGVVWTLHSYDPAAPFFTRNADGGYTIATAPPALPFYSTPSDTAPVTTITSEADGKPSKEWYIDTGTYALVGVVGTRTYVDVISTQREEFRIPIAQADLATEHTVVGTTHYPESVDKGIVQTVVNAGDYQSGDEFIVTTPAGNEVRFDAKSDGAGSLTLSLESPKYLTYEPANVPEEGTGQIKPSSRFFIDDGSTITTVQVQDPSEAFVVINVSPM